MKTGERSIVGAFIFSVDSKILLGLNRRGGVYQGQLTIPGGGIEPGETPRNAVIREIMEETGIDITNESIIPIDEVSTGESRRIDPDTGEIINVKMTFHDFIVHLSLEADETTLSFEDDWGDGKWYTAEELHDIDIAPTVRKKLMTLGFMS